MVGMGKGYTVEVINFWCWAGSAYGRGAQHMAVGPPVAREEPGCGPSDPTNKVLIMAPPHNGGFLVIYCCSFRLQEWLLQFDKTDEN